MTFASLDMSSHGALDTSLRKPSIAGLLGGIIMIGILGIWVGMTVIGGAVIAQGQIVVKGKPQIIQTLDGGIVNEVLVQDGDIVKAGDVILRLDPTILSTNRDIAYSRLAASLALRARLEVERQGQDTLSFAYPALPFERPDTTTEERGQQEIFEARHAVRQGNRAKLAETLAQFDNQITGAKGQIAALDQQLAYMDTDIQKQRKLVERGLARESQLSELSRNKAELMGRAAALDAELARLINARKDAELTTLQQERSFLEEVVTELREANTATEELILDIATRNIQLDRVDIRAPASGIVHEMLVSTTGAVLSPGGTISQVVPLDKGLDFELRIDPSKINEVHVGQDADIILSAFDRQNTPKLAAHVAGISADAIADTQTGRSFYRVTLNVPPEELALIGEEAIKPGMPVEAYLKTGDRTVLSYLVQPVANHLRRAFRE